MPIWGAAIAGGIGALGGMFNKPKGGNPQRDFYYRQLYGNNHNGLLNALMRDKRHWLKTYDNKYQMGVIDRYGKGEMARETANASASGLGNTTARFVAQRGVGQDVNDMKEKAILTRLGIGQGFNDRAYQWALGGTGFQPPPPQPGNPALGQLFGGLGQSLGAYTYQNGMPGPNNSQAYQDQQQWLQLMQMYGQGGGVPTWGTTPAS